MWAWAGFLLLLNASCTCLLLYLPVHVQPPPSTPPVLVVWFYVLSFSLVVSGLPLPHHCNPPCARRRWYTCFYGCARDFTPAALSPAPRITTTLIWCSHPDKLGQNYMQCCQSSSRTAECSVVKYAAKPLIHKYISFHFSGLVVSALIYQISCVYIMVLESPAFTPCCFFLCEHLLFFELKPLVCSCVQRGAMSAVKIGVGRLEMNNMPATALMTVWPEETVVPTTRNCAKVCNFKYPIYVI